MAELSSSDWSETDASNDVTPPAGWPAGMQPNQVEPTARGMMGAIKRFWNRINPTYTTTGSAGAYVFTPSNTGDPTAYVQGESYTFKANFTSVGADTLNVNSLGALGIYKSSGSGPLAIVAGDIQNNTMVSCAYDSALNSGSGGFQLLGGGVNFYGSAAISAPNKLINPFLEIDQANEGGSVSLASGTASYVVDMFLVDFHSSTAVVSAQRVTDAPTGYPSSLKVTVGTGAGSVAGNDFLEIYQPIEGNSIADTAFGTAGAQSLALTFWIKSSVSGTYSGCIQNAAETRSYPFNFTLSSANTWTKFTQVVPGDTSGTWNISGSSQGMNFIIGIAQGSTYQGTVNTWQSSNVAGTSSNSNTVLTTTGATFQLGPCKLELSTIATPIIRGYLADELIQCQRYYEKSYSAGTAPGTAVGAGSNGIIFSTGGNSAIPNTCVVPIAMKVTKRSAPSVVIYDGAGTSGDFSYFASAAWHNAGTGGSGTANENIINLSLPGSSTALSFGVDFTANSRF